MGALNFSIECCVSLENVKILFKEYEGKNIYQKAFSFNSFDENISNYDVGIIAMLDNFLPACSLIYKFLSMVQEKIKIRTNNIETIFNFSESKDFTIFMYSCWYEKIENMFRNYGTVLLNSKKYYKIRNKLYNKYYEKIIN